MKIIIAIITFGLFFSCNSRTPEIKSNDLDLTFLKIENINSISVLFDNSIVKGNQILWPLGYQDIYEFTNELSSDSLCHTTIDTIIKLDNKYFVIEYFGTNCTTIPDSTVPLISVSTIPAIPDSTVPLF